MAGRRLKQYLCDLWSNGFMTLKEYEKRIAAGDMVKSPPGPMMLSFSGRTLTHPLARKNRFACVDAADGVLNIAIVDRPVFSTRVMKDIYGSLFDCSAAVRGSLSPALLFHGGDRFC